MTDKCKNKVQEQWDSTRDDLEALFNAEEYETEELGSLYDYGLSIDKVEAGTFNDQRAPYIRYQFSWGGPSDELRIYENGDLEYWFLDWFDGACVDVTNDEVARQAADWAKEAVQA